MDGIAKKINKSYKAELIYLVLQHPSKSFSLS